MELSEGLPNQIIICIWISKIILGRIFPTLFWKSISIYSVFRLKSSYHQASTLVTEAAWNQRSSALSLKETLMLKSQEVMLSSSKQVSRPQPISSTSSSLFSFIPSLTSLILTRYQKSRFQMHGIKWMTIDSRRASHRCLLKCPIHRLLFRDLMRIIFILLIKHHSQMDL